MEQRRTRMMQPRLITAIPEDYDGPVREYEEKELWFATEPFGGMLNAASIMQGNGGGEGYPIGRFINSKEGEMLLREFKYELCIYGPRAWNRPEMTEFWASQGIVQKAYRTDDPKHEIVVFAPDDMEENCKYPVIMDYHGGGGTIFEAINHGFVRGVKENSYIVACPEEEGTDTQYVADHLAENLDFLETEGYPIDRRRVYLTGHSMGCVGSLYTALNHSDLVAAIAVHSGSGAFGNKMGFLEMTDVMYAKSNPIPMYLEMGEYDAGNLPLEGSVIEGINQWIAMNQCQSRAIADSHNMVGVSGDAVYTKTYNELEYTFVDFKDGRGDAVVRLVGVEMLAHWVSYTYPRLAWEFLKKYERGENGRSVIR